jgi:hypothetical protein
MNKQQTIELLQQQLPGFYSIEQVIKLINDIDVDETSQSTAPLSLTEDQFEKIKEKIYYAIENCMGNMYSDDLVNTDTAEFSLNGNEIQLDSVDVNTDEIADNINDAVVDVLSKVVTVIEEVEA